MHRICAALYASGFQITLIGFEKTKSTPLLKKPYHQIRLKVKNKKGKLFFLEYNYKLFQFLKKRNFDILCAIDLDTALPNYLVSKKKNRTLVLDAHELYLGLPEIINRPLVKFIWTRLENYIYPKLKFAYTVNESIATIYKKKYGVDFKVILNAPDLLPENENSSEGINKTILYQGALNIGRGLEELIEAMQFVDAKLQIAGTGEIDEKLMLLSKELKLEDKVEFLGYLLPEALNKVSKKAYIGTNLLNAISPNYYYSLANKFFDYMHAEIPQLSMDFPEYKNINAKFEIAVLLQNLNSKEIAQQLNALLEDANYYQKLKGNCKLAKKVFNWQNETEKLVLFYKKITHG